MSTLNVDKVDPNTGTTLELGTSGDTVSLPSGATLDISASTLTPPATMPASSGINFTALNATNLGSGTVPTARLGTGTASSSTVLYGDQTYKAEPGGGKVLQMQTMTYGTSESTTSTDYQDSSVTDSITPVSSSNTVLILCGVPNYCTKSGSGGAATKTRMKIALYRGTASGTLIQELAVGNNLPASGSPTETGYTMETMATFAIIDSPSTTSAQTYTMCWKAFDNQTAYVNNDYGSDAVSNMVLMEIDGT